MKITSSSAALRSFESIRSYSFSTLCMSRSVSSWLESAALSSALTWLRCTMARSHSLAAWSAASFSASACA